MSNKQFCCVFWNTVGGDVYRLKESEHWVVVIHGAAFDENGINTKPLGSLVSEDQVDRSCSSLSSEDYEEQAELAIRMYNEYYGRKLRNSLRSVLTPLAFTLVAQIAELRVYLLNRDRKHYAVRVMEKDDIEGKQDFIVSILWKASRSGLTPHIYQIEENESYLYVISDYIPLTLKNVDKMLRKAMDLEARASKIVSKLEDLDATNFDFHYDNFLYDDLNDKLYAIDFEDLKPIIQ